MNYFTIFSLIIVLVILTRLYFLQKEIIRATKQLNQVNSHKTEKKIDLTFFDKNLEKLAIEINRQIDQTKLATGEKRRTENELKQAIANISHDIRTPMTSIIGYLQLLESDKLSVEDQKEYVAVVKNGALRLKVLLEDFFELSIIESTDYPLKIEQIQLNKLVQEVLVGFYEEFNQCQLEPIVQIPEGELIIKADSSAVKRVLENLLSNAIRHSRGNVTICLVRCQTSVELVISNPENQMSDKTLSLLFDRFYKADKTRTGKGTGLGLPIAKSLMVKMNGNLTAELKDGQLYMKCVWEN